MTIHSGVHLEKEDVFEINKMKSALIRDNYHCVLHVCGTETSMGKEARELFASKESAENQLAKAIVINSLAQKLMANFFIRFNKPPEPVKVFGKEEEALAWLDKFIE